MPGASDPNSGGATGTAEMTDDNSMSDEWEYEYDEAETEVGHTTLRLQYTLPISDHALLTCTPQSFYINLDLTSANGVIRPPRVRTSAAAHPDNLSTPKPQKSRPSGNSSPEEESDDDEEEEEPQESDQGLDSQDEIQIMGLHTRNPIISYKNHVFSCSWADMIGTELLFSHPEGRSDLPSVRKTKKYDLISANRVKIIGKKGTLIASSEPVREYPGAESNNYIPIQGNGLVQSNSPPKNFPPTNQGKFLKRLSEAKRARGEIDEVRTTFSQKRSDEFDAQLRGWARTEEQMAEFEKLNTRALQGDSEALAAIQEIYDSFEAGPSAEDGDSFDVDDSDDGNDYQ
ncbi:hypothetical protein FQN54_000966 [Arachnomyces sp. PD_36]|nr:hypothetical protein FQN54_000966 [Arachnomyces sp. PD_36]